jgi:hypothetical protein
MDVVYAFFAGAKTATGAGLSRHAEHENTGCSTCINEPSDAQFFISLFQSGIFSFALLTGDG